VENKMMDITCKTETKWNNGIMEKECEVVGWINLDLHRQKWRAIVDMVMNLQVS
jgi:hypothetical protein